MASVMAAGHPALDCHLSVGGEVPPMAPGAPLRSRKKKALGKRRLCRCGCGQQTGSKNSRWVKGHYTRQVRSENWERTRRGRIFRKQADMFQADLDRLGKRTTKADLLALLHDARLKGYRAGYLAGRAHGGQPLGRKVA
jgi:hypothetical protein